MSLREPAHDENVTVRCIVNRILCLDKLIPRFDRSNRFI